ncbi:hypothetical protein VitviT2T_025091 [Vitis vinifera]|uniref:Uncharacterized protein n=1 Tax=Vitis vinifera TaxID=29760 RepID=A0ABY9DJM6_VITVI|nr:hypothetical protein VitviT2T_025091 [Vitis vinifera]
MGKTAHLFTIYLSTREVSTGGTMKRRAVAAQGKEEQWRRGEEGSRGGDPVTFRRCCRHGGWCRCARSWCSELMRRRRAQRWLRRGS